VEPLNVLCFWGSGFLGVWRQEEGGPWRVGGCGCGGGSWQHGVNTGVWVAQRCASVAAAVVAVSAAPTPAPAAATVFTVVAAVATAAVATAVVVAAAHLL
jgi:hypothetical protein